MKRAALKPVSTWPGVQTIPERQRTQFLAVWDKFRALQRTTPNPNEHLVPPPTAALLLNLSPHQLLERTRAGTLPLVAIGRDRFIPAAAIERFAQTGDGQLPARAQPVLPATVPQFALALLPRAKRKPRESSHPWTKDDETLLGTAPDPEIARRLSRTVNEVKYRRHQLGIPAFPSKIHWAKETEKLLGTAPDAIIAAKIGTSFSTVQRRRRELGIPPHGHYRTTWTQDELDQLGKDTDAAVARKLGKSLSAVVLQRRALDRRLLKPQRWMPAAIALLGTMPDAAVARLLGLSVSGVTCYRQYHHIAAFRAPRFFTPADDALLGTMTDKELAAKLGCAENSVFRRRTRLGIPPKIPDRLHWSPREDRLLGTMPDADLARKLGRTPRAIYNRRYVLHIPAFKPAPARQ